MSRTKEERDRYWNEEVPQRMRELSIQRREALRDLLQRNHVKAMEGKAGGAVICVCGAGCGGTPECSAFAELLRAEEERDFYKSQLEKLDKKV